MLIGLLVLLVTIGITITQILLIPFHALHWIHLPFWLGWLPVAVILAWCFKD